MKMMGCSAKASPHVPFRPIISIRTHTLPRIQNDPRPLMSLSPLRFEIAEDHPCLPGHFPGQPVVPGVVVLDRVFSAIEAAIEATAQTQNAALPPHVRLPQVKFVQPLLPGQPARIELDAIPAAATSIEDALGAPPARWRFKVVRDADNALLASGEVHVIAAALAA
jgi:3-hydroxyacyl-[acyl-carrier-protein] dehydratase